MRFSVVHRQAVGVCGQGCLLGPVTPVGAACADCAAAGAARPPSPHISVKSIRAHSAVRSNPRTGGRGLAEARGREGRDGSAPRRAAPELLNRVVQAVGLSGCRAVGLSGCRAVIKTFSSTTGRVSNLSRCRFEIVLYCCCTMLPNSPGASCATRRQTTKHKNPSSPTNPPSGERESRRPVPASYSFSGTMSNSGTVQREVRANGCSNASLGDDRGHPDAAATHH